MPGRTGCCQGGQGDAREDREDREDRLMSPNCDCWTAPRGPLDWTNW